MPVITLYTNGTVLETDGILVYKLDPSEADGSCDTQMMFTVSTHLIGIRVWKKTSSGEVELTQGEPVAVVDITNSNLQDYQVNHVYGYWTITSTISLNSTDELVIRIYHKIGTSPWNPLASSQGFYLLVWRTVNLNAVSINPSTIAVRYSIYLSISEEIKYLLAGGSTSYTRFENINITLAATYKVSGYTRDQNNNPLGNCTVVLFDASTDQKVTSTVSGSDGYYEFTGLSSPGPYYLRAYKSGSPNLIGTTSRNIYGEQE